MIFPDKHVKLSESFLGLGSYVIKQLDSPKTIDQIWKNLSAAQQINDFPSYHSFENLVLTLDMLYGLGIIEENDKGKLVICNL
jgi:hypothetical protein